MNSINLFNTEPFIVALKEFFKELNVPINYLDDKTTTAKKILNDTYKDNSTFTLINDVYVLGIIDDAAFENTKSQEIDKIKSDYDGILIFGITLHQRESNLLPTRSQLAEISRAFNREFYFTPVVIIFKYHDNQSEYLAFANTERLKYKQEWREGEKAGKVSLLRDVNIEKLHSGHDRILKELKIPTTGTTRVDSFAKLYNYWQEVFSVSILNKKFYLELSTWYFWATKHVTFPGEPTLVDAHLKNAKLEDLVQEHKATNVIRMLTRLLFVWFIKEKKLIPEELFELETLQKEILNEISPYHDETSMFKGTNKESVYYKAVLQNLFFATLNCPIQGDNLDSRKRGFRGEGYGTHRGIDYLMRYKQYFKNPDRFLEMLNKTVPFLNGGLFECLDDKFKNLYIDGFSDQMTKGEQLIVPDYLFFGVTEEADISDVIGIEEKKYKNTAVKGLVNILKSYKFTITENTPIEEDVALDPELLGKVFENLLASYNPETKTTARKQTGSFYTPREIVNYMVDESLIAYLKNHITNSEINNKELDQELHVLTSFDSKVPFMDDPMLQNRIITALSNCTILDPACGSGAFPMGILQKMVHILKKLDPENKVWKEVQLQKAEQESKAAFEIDDKQARQDQLFEINEAFDQNINDPDYARKLFLIENCIYGVDIQPIATQISKLRFFISLVVEQKVNPTKNNFGIRPLPNLETKFLAANTLIGIEKPSAQLSLFDSKEVKLLEIELKKIRHKLFSAKSKETKLKYRQEDERLRNAIASELEVNGWSSDTAQKLASWDPYTQNVSSPFFDPEWMFGLSKKNIGIDVVESKEISVINVQIDSINKQVEALNLSLKLNHVQSIVKLQLISAQLQVNIIETELSHIQKKIELLYGTIHSSITNIVNEPIDITYTIKGINKSIVSLNKTIKELSKAINPISGSENEGVFDIVIGNPPYITYKGKEIIDISDTEIKQLIALYPNSAEYKVNSYALFTERGLNLLSANGTLSYIIPSTILQNEYLKKIRKFLITKYHISQIVSFSNRVFEAVTDSIILFANNIYSIDLMTMAIRKTDLDFLNFEDLKTYTQFVWNNDKNGYVINLKTNKAEESILSKIENECKYIEDYLEVYVGIVANGIKKFLSSSIKDSNHKKYLQGKHIGNFELKPDELFINFIKEELHSNTDESVYLQKEKILVRKTGNRLIAVIDFEQYFTDQSIYNLYPKKDKTINLKVITGLLNSTLLEYYFNKKMITNPDIFPYIKGIHLKKLPLKLPKSKTIEDKFEAVVLKITEMKIKGENSLEIIKILNEMVYKLYELTYDEVKVIDPEFTLTEAEYNAITLE